MSPAGGSNTAPPNTARAGPASKEGATLISVLRTGSIAGLHYYGVAMEPLPWRYSEKYAGWLGGHCFARAVAREPMQPWGPPRA